MKHLPKLIALVAIALFALAACNVFTYSASDLKGKALTYYTNLMGSSSGNGHDNTVLTFNSDGTGGSFEYSSYSYYWATSALYATANYGDRTWYRTGGSKGTFTWDEDTNDLTITYTHYYAPTATAAGYGSGYASADYAYMDLDTYYGHTGVTEAIAGKVKLTADSLYYIYSKGSADNTWVFPSTTTYTYTNYSDVYTTTYTYTITDGSFIQEIKIVDTETISGTATTNTMDYIANCIINHAFIVGKEDKSDETFADVWKEGNAVTLQIEQTQLDTIVYTGATAPTAPTVGTSGIATTTTSTGYYTIDKTVRSTATVNLTYEKDYLLDSSLTTTAARHLK